jgi:hypothetical protein
MNNLKSRGTKKIKHVRSIYVIVGFITFRVVRLLKQIQKQNTQIYNPV